MIHMKDVQSVDSRIVISSDKLSMHTTQIMPS